MTSDAVDQRTPPPLLTLGRVDLARVQVGYRAQPDGPVYQQFLIDLPMPGSDVVGPDRDAVDEAQVLLVNLAKDLAAKGEIIISKSRGDEELVY